MTIEDIIARAAPPPSRVEGGAFEPVETPVASLALRHERLKEAFGTKEALAAHTEALGLAPDRWLDRFRDVRLTGPEPAWARCFRRIFERLSEREQPMAAVRRGAARDLREVWPADLPSGPDVLEGALDVLARRLGNVLSGTVRYERRLGGVWTWRERFERSPALAYALGQVAADWCSSIAEIGRRAGEDRRLIARTFFDAEEPGTLRAMETHLGDPHHGGRSVAVLHFDRGSVVYKPKDLRIATTAGAIVALVGTPGIAAPELLLRQGYAWERFHRARPLPAGGGGADFYRALGGWLALLQPLGAVDFWFDNLIADGGVPRFLDFETAVQPIMARSGIAMPLSGAAMKSVDVLPGGVGILPLHFPTGEGRDPTDIGCLARPGTHRAPLRDPERGGQLLWSDDRFAPRDAETGQPLDVSDHFEAFEDGYLEVFRRMRERGVRERILLLLGRIADAPVRVIRMDTWTCYRIMNRSLAPRELSNAVWREALLHASIAGRPGFEAGEMREAVVADLRRLDVPLLQTRLDSRDLGEVGGARSPGFFRCDAIAATRERFETLSEASETEQVAILRSSFGIRMGNDRWRDPAGGEARPATATDLLAWADEVASGVVSRTVPDRRGGPTWIGLTHDVYSGVRALGPVGFDLLSGRAGIARALLRLARELDRPELGALARETLVGVARQYLDHAEISVTLGAGYVVGGGGLIAALAADPELRELAEEVHARAAGLEIWMQSGDDFVSGLAGWRHAAAILGEESPGVHGKQRSYAPSARARLARWLDPEAARPLCPDRRAAVNRRLDRDRHGSWFAAEWLDDRHHLSGLDGVPALAVRFTELAREGASGRGSAGHP